MCGDAHAARAKFRGLSRAVEIRRKLGHPVIDGDAHLFEVGPVLLDFLEESRRPRYRQRYRDLRKHSVCHDTRTISFLISGAAREQQKGSPDHDHAAEAQRQNRRGLLRLVERRGVHGLSDAHLRRADRASSFRVRACH